MTVERAVSFKSNPVRLAGSGVEPGQQAPDFTVVSNGLQPVTLGEGRGKVIILSSVPSLDTGVCDMETRRFNQEAAKLGDAIEIWTISCDLPFAQARWCGAAGVESVRTLSDFRDRSFGKSYGVLIEDGPLAGLDTRAVFVIDRAGVIRHAQYVPEITTEPDYEAALEAARQAANA